MNTSTLTRPHRGASAWLALLRFATATTTAAVIGGVGAGSSAQTNRRLDVPPFARPSAVFSWVGFATALNASIWWLHR